MRHLPWDLQAERRFRAAVVQACGAAGPLEEVWLVAPHSLVSWYRHSLMSQAAGACSLATMDWELAAGTLEARLLLPRTAPARRLDVTAALMRALAALARVDGLPGTLADALRRDPLAVATALYPSASRLLEDAHGVHDTAGAAPTSPFVAANMAFLVQLKDAVVADLQARGLATGALRWAAIAAALATPHPGSLPTTLILDGIDTLDGARGAAVAGLRASGVTLLAPPWLPLTGLASVELALPTSPAPQLEVAVRHCRDVREEALAAGHWVDAGLEAGIPLAEMAIMVPPGAGYESVLAEVFAAADLPVACPQALAPLATREFQALRAYLALRTGPFDVVDLVTLLGGCGLLERATLQQLADTLYAQLPANLASLQPGLAELGVDVSSLLAPLGAPAAELETLWSTWLVAPDAAFQAACQEVLEAFPDLYEAKKGFKTWLIALETLLELPSPTPRRAGEVLEILHAGPYAPAPLARLLVLGFNDGAFPGSQQLAPLLGLSEIAAFGDLGVAIPTPADRAVWEARNVQRLLDCAAEVTVSVPERGVLGDVRRPSPWLEFVTGQVHPPLAACDATKLTTRPTSRFTLPPALVEQLLGTLSPSSIDVLLSCPFAFYSKALVRLNDRPVTRALGWDAALAGTLGHQVLEAMLARASDTTLDVGQVSATLESVVRTQFPGLDASRHRLRLENLRQMLEAFVRRYVAIATDLGTTGGHSEWRFGYPHPLAFPLGDGRTLPIRGSIDRVLLRKGRPIAIDFKSGDVAKYPQHRAAGLGAQVALYAWAIREAGLGLPAAFMYLTLADRRVEQDVVLAEAADTTDTLIAAPGPSLEAFQATFQQQLTSALATLRAGQIAPVDAERAAVLDAAKAAPCTYCDFDLLCHSKVGTR